jgi:hypothetical protein
MRFDMTTPCGNCPFRNDRGPFGLRAERVREILGGGQGRAHWPATSFPCHKTIDYSENEDGSEKHVIGPDAQQCAGVMLILYRENRPNDAMQLGERFRLWNPAKLAADAPVYASTAEAIERIPYPGDRR